MIYNIKIGTRDNCYIITGGLEGISTFEPIEVDGTQNSVVIHVDSESDDIFTPWIKQSLEVQFLKYNDGDFDDIIAGNDNLTYGILIEDGGLDLVSGDLRITSGGKLKFIGTLTLETYTEQYKHISPISFIFHDRIGSLEDYDFTNNVQYKNICDIIACCIYPIVCSNKLFLEWPYTLSGSDDPQEFLLELSDMDEKTNKEMLETVLKDFGLQMVVDYSKNVQTNLKDSGAIVIRSVIEHPETSNTFWELNLTSYIASTCQRQYYTYTGTKGSPIAKPLQMVNTSAIPLLENSTLFQLERVASSIVATNELNLKDSLIFRSNPNMDYSIKQASGRVGSYVYKYCPYAQVVGNSSVILTRIKKILDDGNLSSVVTKPTIDNNVLFVPTTSISEHTLFFTSLITTPIRLSYNLFTAGKYKLNINVKGGVNSDLYSSIIVFCSVIIKKNSKYYINDNNNFIEFNNGSYVNDFNSSVLGSFQPFEKKYNLDLSSSGEYIDLVFCLTANYQSFAAKLVYVESLEVIPVVDNDESIPKKIELTTNLTGNNRKIIELNPRFLNAPNISGGAFWPKNIIMDNNLNAPFTVDYKGLPQTMLAHLSDQYGWQYDGNRWNMEATIKGESSTFDIVGLFGIDEKRMMLLNGDYDARYRELKGKWGQIIRVTEDYDYIISETGEQLISEDLKELITEIYYN